MFAIGKLFNFAVKCIGSMIGSMIGKKLALVI